MNKNKKLVVSCLGLHCLTESSSDVERDRRIFISNFLVQTMWFRTPYILNKKVIMNYFHPTGRRYLNECEIEKEFVKKM